MENDDFSSAGVDELARLRERIEHLEVDNAVLRSRLPGHSPHEQRREEIVKQYRAVLAVSPQVVWLGGPDGHVTYGNQYWRDYTGLTLDETLGEGWLDAIVPDHRERVRTAWREAVRDGQEYEMETRFRRASDGEYRWFLVKGAPVRDEEEGRIDQWVGIALDIHERKQAEEKASHTAALLQQMIDAMPQLVFTTLPDGYHDRYNRRWYEYTGLSLHETEGEGWNHVFHPDDQERAWQRWNHSLKTGEPYEVEYRCRRYDGVYRWFLGRAMPIYDDAGRIIRWFGTCTDIDDQKQAEQAQGSLLALSGRISELRLPDEVAGETVQWLCEFLQADDCAMDTPEGSVAGTVKANVDGPYTAAGVPLTLFGPELLAEVHAGNVVQIDDTAKDSRTATRYTELYGLAKSAAILSVPVHRDGKWVASFTIQSRTPRAWLPHEVQFVEAAVQRAWPAYETARLLQAVKSGEDRFRAAVQAVGDIIWTNDAQGRMIGEQPGWGSFTGQTFEQYQGYGWANAVHPDDASPTIAEWNRCVAEKCMFVHEHRVRRHDGVYRIFSIRAVPVIADDGTTREWVGVHTDISDQRRAEEELREAKLQAEDASKAKSAFLASMSHELRTPLNAIIGYGEMLQEEAEDLQAESLIPDLRKIHSAGRHLLALINDVLDLSKIEAGKMDLYLETFQVGTMVDEAVSTVQQLVEKNGNRLVLEADPAAGAMKADLTKVRQSLFNLLSNAAKFTTKGTITLRVEDAGPEVVFRVTDTGIGMTEEQQAKLFEPFTQADARTARLYGGTGLGLALTQRFVELMGGSISVSSAQGVGSTFTIRLPREVAERSAEQSETRTTGDAEPATEEDHKGLVLVIDDDPNARDLIQRVLVKEGFRAETAASGPEGLQKARDLKPVAITLDVMMPHMDGWAVLGALKADNELCDVPVIMITIVDNRQFGYALGASDYLTKPVDREQLGAVLRRYACHGRVCNVMIVDDETDARHLLRQMLEKETWSVCEAGNGREALAAMTECKPDLIILDLLMPEMDGFEFSLALRRDAAWSHVPIVVLTSKDITAEDRARLNGHVERIISKGEYPKHDLIAEIQRVLASYREHPRQH